jgi:hypothetical protein
LFFGRFERGFHMDLSFRAESRNLSISKAKESEMSRLRST